MAREELDQLPLMAESGVVERKRWSSVYYAMFYAAEAALRAVGFEPRTHTGVNTLVGKELYKERQLVDKEHASFYSEMRRLREDLDYSPYAVLPERSLDDAIDLAETFIDTMAAIVDREQSG